MIFTVFRDTNAVRGQRVHTDSIITFFQSRVGELEKEASKVVGLYKLFDGTTRKKVNVETVYAFAIDVDGGIRQEELQDRLASYSHLIYHTHSSTPEKHKMRAVFPISRPMTSEEYRFVFRWAAEAWPFIDKACSDASRMFYLRSPVNELIVNHGKVLDIDEIIGIIGDRIKLEDLTRDVKKLERDFARLKSNQETFSRVDFDNHFTMENAERLLDQIDPDVEYHIVRNITWILRDQFGDDCYELWLDWQSGCVEEDHQHRIDNPEGQWRSIGHVPDAYSIGTLIYYAKGGD